MSVVGSPGSAHALGMVRGDVVVGVPVFGAPERFAPCLLSLLRHTPGGVPIVVWDDGSPGHDVEPIVRRALDGIGRDRIVYRRADVNEGTVASFNAIAALAAPADVILVNSDVVVADGWFEGLRGAAWSDDRIATATALTNHGTIVSVPVRNSPTAEIANGLTPDEAAARVRRHSLMLRPELPTAVGHCFYIRREALDLVGGFDPIFSPGYFEEVDFSQRCVAAGLRHVCADDVFVFHAGGGSFPADVESSARYARSSSIIDSRYPHFRPIVERFGRDRDSQLAHAIDRAAFAMRKEHATVGVTIDARCLDRVVTGTQVHVLELIRALHDSGRSSLRVVVPEDVDPSVEAALATMPELDVARVGSIGTDSPKTDVVHRPFQANGTWDDLEFSRSLGHRFVLTQQDFIGFDNPSYFEDPASYERYRELSRLAMAVADRVVFSTRYVGDDAVRRGLVSRDRMAVVNLGAGHLLAEPRAPAGRLDRRVRQPYLMLAGTDYQHKNRRFAIDVVRELRARYGWDGRLVLCGVRMPHGTSAQLEAEAFLAIDDADDLIIDLGEVAEADMRGLLAHASGVLYPTVSEGFGFVPFEAAGVGVPCFFAPVTSLGEVLPLDAALIEPWDVGATAERIALVLDDAAVRESHIRILREAAAPLTWVATAAALIDTYEALLREPRNPTHDLASGRALDLTAELHRVYASRSWRYARPLRWLRRSAFGSLRPGSTRSH